MTDLVCTCGKPKEKWMEVCKQCFVIAKKKSGGATKDKNIQRQVFLKVAGVQAKGTPQEVIQYAKDLEKEFQAWA